MKFHFSGKNTPSRINDHKKESQLKSEKISFKLLNKAVSKIPKTL